MKPFNLWNRMMSLLLCVGLVLSCLTGISLPAKAETTESTQPSAVEQAVTEPAKAVTEDTLSDDGKWSVAMYAEGVQITAYHGTAADVYVPANVKCGGEAYAVMKLADSLFADNDSLNSVTLGGGIPEIGARAFYDCDNLVCIVTNETLTAIGAEAFYSCDSFNSVILYDAVASIGENAFAECPKLTVWVNENSAAHSYVVQTGIPCQILNPDVTPETYTYGGVTYYIMNGQCEVVGVDAAATEVTILSSVEGFPVVSIHAEAFKKATALETVTFPDSLQTIGNSAFTACTALKKISIPENVSEIGTAAFSGCDALEEAELLCRIDIIAESMFSGCDSLRQVSFPEGVQKIDTRAFSKCTGLEQITFNEALTHIGAEAFRGCTALTQLTIPDCVTYIGSLCFAECTALKECTIGTGMQTIMNRAFERCTALQRVYIGSDAPNLNGSVFSNCSRLSEIEFASRSWVLGGAYNFIGCISLRQITLQDNLCEIPEGTFCRCTALESIQLPATVTDIGKKAFYGCTALKEVTVSEGDPAGDTAAGTTWGTIGQEAFYECTALETVTIPKGVKAIDLWAFYHCIALRAVTIPEGVTTIGDKAFERCGLLRWVDIPSTVTKFGEAAMSSRPILLVREGSAGHTFAQTNHNMYLLYDSSASLEETTVDGIRYLLYGNEAIAVECDPSAVEVTIPEQVNGVPVTRLYGTFASCKALTRVEIPASVTQIGSRTFSGCSLLTDVVLPENLSFLGCYAFYNCDSLTQISIPGTVQTVGEYAFGSCDRLTNVTLGEGVSVLKAYSFSNSGLTEIRLPESLQVIETYAFSECDELVRIDFPEKMESIGYLALYNCDSLRSVELPAVSTVLDLFGSSSQIESISIPEGVEKLSCNFSYPKLATLVIPNSVTSISSLNSQLLLIVQEGSYAHTYAQNKGHIFLLWDGVTEPKVCTVDNVTYAISDGEAIPVKCSTTATKVTVPATVEGKPVKQLRGTFKNCTKLTSLTLPEGLERIGENSFYDCTALKSITIPSTVNVLESRAFAGCCFTSVTLPEGITTIPSMAFYDAREVYRIVLPSSVKTIEESAFYNTYKLSSINLPEGLTEISDYAFYSAKNLSSIEIPSTVTRIGERAFINTALSRVNLPEGLTEIGYEAFNDTNITSITIPSTVKTVGSDAFESCDNLTSLTICEGATGFGSGVFSYCRSLKTVTIPGSWGTIKSYMFRYCTKLEKVVLGEGIHTLDYYAFGNCTALKEVVFPESLRLIGSNAFDTCSALQEVKLPEGVTKIYGTAFSGCTALRSVSLPDSLQTLSGSAFARCTSLTSVSIPDGVQTVGIHCFIDCTSLQYVRIGAGVQKIDSSAFQNTAIRHVLLPEGLKTIESSVFSGCTAMQYVLIPQSVTTLNKTSFPASTILVVYDGSYAHTYAVNNGLLYFVVQKTENPEISYGAGIAGTVSYIDGTPAGNATVEIFYDDGVLKESVVTDSTGAYEFTYAEVGAYTIRVTDRNGNTASTQVSVKRMNAFDVFLSGDTDLKLKKGWTVSGTVDPCPATVTITDEDGNVMGSVETADGSFAFTNIPNGTYIVTANTENGSVSQEITVFDGNVSDIVLTVAPTAATVWGYVEVEDRDMGHHRRNWVEVTVYNVEGIAVARCKTDRDGKYTFAGLPAGEYSIVAQTAEMRPDHKHGFDRSHTLTGYAYVNVTEAATYQVDTIILREENDCQATISGKVTAHGETQDCRVVLHDVFRSEVASMTTGKNGKYSFKNIPDGLYFITATTNSDGMGFAVVVVHNGKVYGQTDVTVYKTDKIKDREDRFHNEVPHCDSRENALQHRDRIAEEKRFYDSLSEKERKQLSKEYVNRLDQLVRWITDCTVESGEGVTMEQGGLVISGQEAQTAESITFTLNVTPSQAHEASTDGVNSRDDQIYHHIHDKSGKHDVLQYYDITLSKNVDGKQTQITSVTKDTEANGKLRVTMEIPEEYRGYKHYTVIHEHCGDVVTLTDLDNDPNTITFEVKKFSTFVLAGTNITLTEIEDAESALVESWGLTLTDDICINFNLTLSEEILADANAYVEVSVGETVKTIPVSEAEKGIQVALAAAQMTDAVTLCLVDGNGNRSESSSYTVRRYCDTILADASYSQYHALVKEMLCYGAAAQVYFDYAADNLANDGITGSAEAIPESADAMVVSGNADGLNFYGASLVYRDKIAVRYYFTGDVTGCTFAVNGNAYEPIKKGTMHYVEVPDILPQDLAQQITLTVTDADGNTLSVTYGPMNYIVRMNEKGSEPLKTLLKALYNYHLAAKAYCEV